MKSLTMKRTILRLHPPAYLMRKPFEVLAEGLLSENSRGNKTAIEHFVAGVRSWGSWPWRQLENSQSTGMARGGDHSTKPCHDGLRNTGQRRIFHGIAEATFFKELDKTRRAKRTLSGGGRCHLFANVVYKGWPPSCLIRRGDPSRAPRFGEAKRPYGIVKALSVRQLVGLARVLPLNSRLYLEQSQFRQHQGYDLCQRLRASMVFQFFQVFL